MYRDSAKARVAARDLRRQQVKLFKLGATITLCAFLDLSAGRYDLLATFQKIIFSFTNKATRECLEFVFCVEPCKSFCFVYNSVFSVTGESPSWFKAPDSDSGIRGFESFFPCHLAELYVAGESPSWLRHRILIPAFEGSNPSSPATPSLNNLKTLGNRRLYLSYSGDLPYLFLLYSWRKTHCLVRQRSVPCALRTRFVSIRFFCFEEKVSKSLKAVKHRSDASEIKQRTTIWASF